MSVIIAPMDGIGYEDWCAQELRHQGFHNVRKTKASHDQGIDLIAERGNLSWGFQCKYYSSAIGNEAIMQAYAGRAYYGLDRAAVITNSTFTKSAYELAKETDVMLVDAFAPIEENKGSLPVRISACLMLCMCVFHFSQLIKDGNENGFIPAAFVLMGSLCALVFAKRTEGLVISAFMLGISVAVYTFTHAAMDLWSGFLLIFFMIVLIRMTVLLKERNIRNARAEKKRLRKLISAKRNDTAQEIVRLFEAQTEKQITLDEVHEDASGTLILRAHARGMDEQDLALAVYTLNQQARYEGQHLYFAYTMEEGGRFSIRYTQYKQRKKVNN